MSQKRPIVVVTRKLPRAIEERMNELFDVKLNTSDAAMSRSELLEAVATADVLVPTISDKIDKGILSQSGPNLRLVANFGAGVDNIDVQTARTRGIIVTNTPDVLTEDTADMTMALILAVPRRLAEGSKVLEGKDAQWGGWSPTWMLGHRIYGKKLGILGMGRIGQAVARRAKAFGLEIHYHNRSKVNKAIEKELDATYWKDLDDMMAEIDILSINCPHTTETYHIVSSERLKMMKPSSYIVNTARGEVIDEKALCRNLEKGIIAGAGLDVFEHEPAIDPRLSENPKVVVLPHMGSATIEGRVDMGEKVIINIKTFADGHMPPDRVLPSMM